MIQLDFFNYFDVVLYHLNLNEQQLIGYDSSIISWLQRILIRQFMQLCTSNR